jgi:hypothetical protein
VLTTWQPSTVWCSRERLPAAAAQPAKVRQSCSATDYYYLFMVPSYLSSRVRRESYVVHSRLISHPSYMYRPSRPPWFLYPRILNDRSGWHRGLRRGSWSTEHRDRGFKCHSRYECFQVCVVRSCVGRGLATGRSLVQEVLTKCLKSLRNTLFEAAKVLQGLQSHGEASK